MINIIIWSKDRAAQLHLLLESIDKNLPNDVITSVIFTCSSEYFQKGYDRVIDEFAGPKHLFIKENDFRSNTISILKDKDYDIVGFSTDDTVIYKKVDSWPDNFIDNSTVTFSLRLGFNTLVQDCHAGSYQPPLKVYADEGDTISWPFNIYHPNHNYGYPFGLDMHLYSREVMLSLVKVMPFKNTNELESGLFYKKLCVPQIVRSFKHSVAINIPTNNISGVTRHGEQYEYTLDELNGQYLDGSTINLDKIMKQEIVGCHQELPLELNVRSN